MLEGASEEKGSTVTVDADKMEKIERFMERFENGSSEQSMVSSRRRLNLDEEDQWNQDNARIQKIVRQTEDQCKSTYDRIKAQLKHLSELSQSNLALKRLVKRNAKRDAKASKHISSTNSSGSCSGDDDRANMKCKLPFVVAVYQPDKNAAYNRTIKGRSLGMLHKGSYVKVASKKPFKCFDDMACLDFVDLSDGQRQEDERDMDASENQFGTPESKREINKLSRKFVRNYKREEVEGDSSQTSNDFDLEACLEEILQRLPTGRRTLKTRQ